MKKYKGISLVEILISMTLSIVIIGMAVNIYIDIKNSKKNLEERNTYLIKSNTIKYFVETLLNKNGLDCLLNTHSWENNIENKTSLNTIPSMYPNIFSYDGEHSNINALIDNSTIIPNGDFLLSQDADEISTISSIRPTNSYLSGTTAVDLKKNDLLLLCSNSFSKAGYIAAEVAENVTLQKNIPLQYQIENILPDDFISKYSINIIFTAYTDTTKKKSALYLYTIDNTLDGKLNIILDDISDLKIRYYLNSKWYDSDNLDIQKAKNAWASQQIRGIEVSTLINGKPNKININMNKISNFHAV